MASKKTGNPVGRPTDYRPEYCERLIAHMKNGNSFESFGSVVGKSKQTLYDWTKAFPEFLDAKKVGLSHSLLFYEEVGKMMMTGQLKRVKKETPVLDKQGKPMFDKDGKIIVHREYEAFSPPPASWIFMMKNMHKWRDRVEITDDPSDEGPNSYVEFEDAELDRKLTQILKETKASRR